MTKFRPCIDLHNGQVKQIVGGSLTDNGQGLVTNFVSDHAPSYYAELYRRDQLEGGHVILLGPGNDEAACQALAAYPGGLQVGGGISAETAPAWIAAGASHVIVTSWIFQGTSLAMDRLQALVDAVGRERIVLDLSCRRHNESWNIAIHRWQTITPVQINPKTLDLFSDYCAEFLIHAADVEGKQAGMDESLIRYLAQYSPIPVTYAGGARSVADLQLCQDISQDRIDLTIGSALDIFGGKGAAYADCVAFNHHGH